VVKRGRKVRSLKYLATPMFDSGHSFGKKPLAYSFTIYELKLRAKLSRIKPKWCHTIYKPFRCPTDCWVYSR